MFTLRKFNNILSFVVIIIGLYLIVTPILPQIDYWLRDKSPAVIAPYGGDLAKSVDNNSSLPPPIDNRIVIPSIGVNEPIIESSTINSINDGGTWRRPNTAKPPDMDNTVIVAHRFFGNDISTFYHLDKLEVGQLLAIYWEGEEILYEVTETKVVNPSNTEIENSTTEQQLTLYTCTPIWTARDRLVVIAKPMNKEMIDE
jgi:sortase A